MSAKEPSTIDEVIDKVRKDERYQIDQAVIIYAPISGSDTSRLSDTIIPFSTDDGKGCPIFKLPILQDSPKLQDIPDESLNDMDYVNEVLLDHITELTRYINSTKQTIRTTYDIYLRRCGIPDEK